MKKLDSFKVVTRNGSPKRRETENGAMALAAKLRRNGKHGEVQKVLFGDNGIEFETIATF